MNDTLKVAGRIGAELGAAKAENEKLRGLLREVRVLLTNSSYKISGTAAFLSSIDAALSLHTEPTDTFTAVDMATAAAQGFRDGQAAVEQAAAQDELWAVHAQGPDELYAAFSRADAEQHAAALNALPMPDDIHVSAVVIVSPWSAAEHWKYLAEQEREHATDLRAIATRPAQTEQQPVAWRRVVERLIANVEIFDERPRPMCRDCADRNGICESGLDCDIRALVKEARAMIAAPIAQTAPQGKFRMGDLVRKTSGSEWVGRVVGWYSTEQTPEGYAVESSAHRNSVQIYPAKALEAVE